MSAPVIEPSDLGTYLNDPKIDTDRAAALIADAQTLCESVVSPLPNGASVVVKRMAAAAYLSIMSPRQAAVAAAGSQFSGSSSAPRGVFMSDSDESDLRRMAGGGGAFTINLLPTDYAAPPSWPAVTDWDQPI